MHEHIFNNSHNPGTNKHEIYFPLLTANGVTGVRDMWTDPDDLKLVREWQSKADAGKMLIPRIVAGSSIIDGVPTHLPNMLGVSTPDEARSAVLAQKDAGAGFIKVYWRLPPDVFAAIADEAKKLGIPFAGHVPFSMSAAQVSDAGQKSIEHLTGVLETCSSKEDELRKAQNMSPQEITNELWRTYDEQKCRSLFARFAKNKTWQVPTAVIHRMSAFRREADFIKDARLRFVQSDEAQAWLNIPTSPQRVTFEIKKQRFDKMLETIGIMHKTGVPLLAGSDLGNPFIFAGFSLHDELELFVQGGLTPFEALQTATLNPARFLGLEKSLGTIEQGKIADLVLLDADPLANIGHTKRIFAVVANGLYLSRGALDKMLADAEARVKKK
jgi:imidazolonepropionase-like amidohydrolase